MFDFSRLLMPNGGSDMIKAGSETDFYSLNVDCAPTILDLAGAKVPGGMQGKSRNIGKRLSAINTTSIRTFSFRTGRLIMGYGQNAIN